MTRIDIFSGFLGAGKTTLIKKLIAEAYQGEKLVLIENEFGEIGIDGGFLQDAGVQITEMNSGCICCSLVGDFGRALEKVIAEYHPDRILIEPSGVGKLSDVMAAVLRLDDKEIQVGSLVAVADAGKCKLYMKNFGEFYNNQIETATAIILSRTDAISEEKLQACVELIRAHNDHATIITTPWPELTGEQIRDAIEQADTLHDALEALRQQHEEAHDDDHCCCEHEHHHDEGDEHEHHHDEDDEHHHHHDEDDEHEHHHDEDGEHHHHHDEDGEHEHHHDGDDEHHHHHHADEVFTSWGVETPKKFTMGEVEDCLKVLDHAEQYGVVLRAKGIVPGVGGWIHFDYVPGEADVRTGGPSVTGRLCVIGSKLNEDALRRLFGV
ncbi:MAG: CobW family GTP-binding protein [Oscillospiraceae bacterium]|nr:CobW family GTP-binding protein [Oscillospiraceae bacterium]